MQKESINYSIYKTLNFKTSSYLNDVNNFRLFRIFSAEIKIDTLAHILNEQQGTNKSHGYSFMHFNM